LNSFSYQNQTISLHCPWDKLTVTEAFSRYSDTTVRQALADNRFDEIMGLEIEPQLGKSKPLFLYDYPCELAALARKKKSDPLVAERFELYIAGLELCNGFSELTDPVEQRTRFRQEMNNRKESRLDTWDMPENFLEALHFMPEAAGIALGIDRLVMLFADTQNIADVVAFTPEDLA
jgi:lysyl-tRNA synthetase class 2